jgi:hypothetical protein
MHGAAASPPPPPVPGISSGTGGGVGSGSGAGTGPGTAYSFADKALEKEPSQPSFTKIASERTLLESKLSPAILKQFDCWKKQAADCKLAPNGTIEIQLLLTQDPLAQLEKLKALGLNVTQVRSKDKLIIGRLSLDKLTGLAKLETVKFVTQVRR